MKQKVTVTVVAVATTKFLFGMCIWTGDSDVGTSNFSLELDILHVCQSMSGDTCDRTCACPYTCKIPGTSKQWHMPDRNFAASIATLTTVTFCFHNSALPCYVLSETFDMLPQKETLYCE